MKPRQYAGLAILLIVAVIVAAAEFWPTPEYRGAGAPAPEPDPITVTGIIGGKIAFLQDPEVTTLLKQKYGLTVENTVAKVKAQFGEATAKVTQLAEMV